MRSTALVILLAGALGVAGPGAADEALTEYRSEVMEAAHRHLKAVRLLAQEGVPLREQTVLHARALRAFADAVPALFPRGSRSTYSEASPAIWDDWSGFSAAAAATGRAAAELERAARGGDLEAAYYAVLDSCKGCHRRFRER